MTAESEQAGMRTVQRAIDILGLFDESRPAMSIREIVTASGLPKTTVLRLLGTLRMNGLLWVDEHGRYIAGPALLRWSRLAEQAWRLPPAAGVILRDLAAEHKETVHLYVRRDIHRVCIAQEEGPQTLRQVVRVGDELPCGRAAWPRPCWWTRRTRCCGRSRRPHRTGSPIWTPCTPGSRRRASTGTP